MKSHLLALTSVLSLVSTAHSSHFGEYTADQIAFANKLMLCPQEVASIMSVKYTRIVEGGFVGTQSPDGDIVTDYTIKFVKELPAPSFKKTTTLLVIRESMIKTNISAPDAPSFRTVVTCEVK